MLSQVSQPSFDIWHRAFFGIAAETFVKMHLIDITMRLSCFVNCPPSACNMIGIIPLQPGFALYLGLLSTDCPSQNDAAGLYAKEITLAHYCPRMQAIDVGAACRYFCGIYSWHALPGSLRAWAQESYMPQDSTDLYNICKTNLFGNCLAVGQKPQYLQATPHLKMYNRYDMRHVLRRLGRSSHRWWPS